MEQPSVKYQFQSWSANDQIVGWRKKTSFKWFCLFFQVLQHNDKPGPDLSLRGPGRQLRELPEQAILSTHPGTVVSSCVAFILQFQSLGVN